jgi:NitT/TauT family transport system permease protein
MNIPSMQLEEGAAVRPSSIARAASRRGKPAAAAASAKLPLRTLLAAPAAAATALAVHLWISKNEPAIQTLTYTYFLAAVFGLTVLAGAARNRSAGLRRRLADMNPILAAAILTLCAWEVVTTGLRLLPLPYFPSPAAVLRSMIEDGKMLLDCTFNSLLLLSCGYLLGVVVGLVTGVWIGWFPHARYWGMPLLKVIGPIPATAWIPLAMVVSPNGRVSAIGLVALAVWFPVSMLTISGIANTKASYLDVARTLGAKPGYLIFRVAIPAAMSSIFIGLFMGLGASFLTLIHAETVGVKSGLGWYVGWAQGWAEYSKVYAALVIMAAFFSTIMTLLFKVRDRVLVWQKGVIKW